MKRRHVSKVRSYHACRLKWREWATLRMGRWVTRRDYLSARRLHLAR